MLGYYLKKESYLYHSRQKNIEVLLVFPKNTFILFFTKIHILDISKQLHVYCLQFFLLNINEELYVLFTNSFVQSNRFC